MNKRLILLFAGILLVFPYSAVAQTGSISGVITDSLQNPVPLARVSVSGAAEAAITDINGSYLIENLSPGLYDITVNHSEFHRAVMAEVEVIEDSAISVDIGLLPPYTGEIEHGYMTDDEIWLPVSISNYIAVGEFDFLIKWLPDHLILESVYPSNRTDNGYLSYIIDDAGSGTVRIHWDSEPNNPLPAGYGPVIFLHFQADSSLNRCDVIPVNFTGSQIDNAVFDTEGETVFMDNLFSGSIMVVEPTSYACFDPDFNGWPLDLGDPVNVGDRLIYGYAVWKINPPLQEIMADVNNNGIVDVADAYVLSFLIGSNSISEDYPLLRFPSIIDPSIRDAFIVGNLDGSPVIGFPDEEVEIPIYIRTDEEIESFVLRLSTDTSRISERLDVELTPVLDGWSVHTGREFDFQPGYRGQTAFFHVDSGVPLNTGGQWSDAIAYFTLRLADHGFTGGESILLKARASVVDSNYVVYQPLLIEGSILVEIENCSYTPGDANDDGLFNGLDIVFSVGYFKGQWSSVPTDCYCGIHGFYGANGDSNGDCVFNGLDVIYSVAALKGTGPLPQACPDCPPE